MKRNRLKKFLAHEGPVIFFAAVLLLNVGCSHDKKNNTVATDSDAGQGAPPANLVGSWIGKETADHILNNSNNSDPCYGFSTNTSDSQPEFNFVSAEINVIDASGAVTTDSFGKDQNLKFVSIMRVGSNGKAILAGLRQQMASAIKVSSYQISMQADDSTKEMTVRSHVVAPDIDSTSEDVFIRLSDFDMKKIAEKGAACAKQNLK